MHELPKTRNHVPSLIVAAILGPYFGATGTYAQPQSVAPHPLRIVVPFPPGGNSDVVARPLAQRLSDVLGQQVMIDNRPGASGIIAMELIAKSQPDGSALLLAPTSTITVTSHLHSKMPINVFEDLAPVTTISQFDQVLLVNPIVPVRTVKDLIVLAKQKPGVLSYASSGVGSGFHLTAELFKSMAGVNILHVPYKGGLAPLTDVIGGRVDMMFYTLAVVAPLVNAGKLRALAVTGRKRPASMPQLPTMSEAGVPGYEYTGSHGVFAPAGTSKQAIEKLNTSIAAVLGTREMKEFYARQDVEAVTSSPDEYATLLRAEYEKWGRILRASGVKPE
jgi:tripartite-type tricarboxylate transporter receptor subunit TctC